MAVRLEKTILRWRGLSTDTKPESYRETRTSPLESPPEGSTFTETDTGKRWVWHNGGWEHQEQTVETALAAQTEVLTQMLAVLRATHRGHEEYGWEHEVPTEG